MNKPRKCDLEVGISVHFTFPGTGDVVREMFTFALQVVLSRAISSM